VIRFAVIIHTTTLSASQCWWKSAQCKMGTRVPAY